MNFHIQTVLRVSKALADETRLKILALLLDHDLCGKALANRLSVSEAAVSQHLKTLKAAGLIAAEKRGYWMHYGLERKAFEEAVRALQAISRRSAFPGNPCRRMARYAELSSKREDRTMCCQSCCERPDQLKEAPETCSPEQIIKCHGDAANHPCTEKKKTGKP